MMSNRERIDKLEKEGRLSGEEYVCLLDTISGEEEGYLFERARKTALKIYGSRIFVRGLVEFTNYCRNDCYYCGIRRSNGKASRYRLTPEQVMECCAAGYGLGFHTFVLQGGDDPWFTDERMAKLIVDIKKKYPDCALTLSVGERERGTYKRWFDAGADRYLLRHETADPCHYASLHPPGMRAQSRQRCLRDLKAIGYQTGCGMMAGSPGQTLKHIARDLEFIHDLQPEMVGIGPFIPHHHTPFKDCSPGTLKQTLLLLAIVRLMLPQALLPATTALGTIKDKGRELGVMAGANVVMPNLSPMDVRHKYMLYDNKISTGLEAAANIKELREQMASIGYEIVTDRGDHISRRPGSKL